MRVDWRKGQIFISTHIIQDMAAPLLAAFAVFFAIYGMIFLTPFATPKPDNLTAANWLLLAMLLFAAAVSLTPQTSAEIKTASSTDDRPINKIAAIIGIGAMVVLSVMNGNMIDLANAFYEKPVVPYWVHFALLVVGITATAWGFSGGGWLTAIRQRMQDRDVRLEVALVAGLTALAYLMRVWQLQSGLRVFVDEVQFTSSIQHLWFQRNVGLLQPMSSVAAFPYAYPFLQDLSTDLFGRNLFAIRYVTLWFGVLSIPALYFMARQFLDRKMSFAAAALLMTFPPHLQFSRLGLNNVADPLMAIMALAFLARGMQHHRRSDFALAGIFLGLTQYFYEGGRLFFPALILGWLVYWILFQGKRPSRQSMAVMAITTMIVAAPIYYTLIGIDRPIFQRVESVRVPGFDWGAMDASERQRQLFRKLSESGMFYIAQPESLQFYGGQTPLLLVFIVPAVGLGLAYALRYWYKPEGALLAVWIAVPVLGAVVLLQQFSSARVVVSYPAVTLLAALGIHKVTDVLLPKRAGLRTAAIIIGLLVAIQFFYYFNIHSETFLKLHYARRPDQETAFLASQLPANTDVHVIDNPQTSQGDARAMVEFMIDGIKMYTYAPDQITPDWINSLRPDANHAFIIAEKAVSGTVLATIEERFDVEDVTPADANRWTPQKQYHMYLASVE